MTPENPFDTPLPKGIRLIQGTLRVVVAIQCWGMAAARLHQQRSTPLSDLLDRVYQIGAQAGGRIEDAVACALVVCGLVILVRPMTFVLIPVIAWQGALAVTAAVLGQGTIPALEPAEQSVRYVAPLALLLIDFWPPRIRPTLLLTLSAMTLLRWAAAVTFAAHGIVALYQFQRGGDFVDLIVLSVQNVLHREITPELAQTLLAGIGAVDVALALCLVTSRNRAIAFWMVLWGLTTAFSRTLAYGAEGYDLTLIRIANGGAPLTVLIFWMIALREQKPVLLAEHTPGKGARHETGP